MEIRAYLSYRRKKLPLTYWRSKSGHKVDFLIGTRTGIEVKASRKISINDFKGLNYLKEEGVFQNLILVSQDPVSTLKDGILTVLNKTRAFIIHNKLFQIKKSLLWHHASSTTHAQ